ncbi:Rieske (2Fe-2S) protein [Actinoplanes sp. HUAS TT8]|uniref:Rieske (2Fe-2S) protein n=1 Tax=Actinoplanes sp. HUAS TT8 TaxID=3447453 RepID=UPI003F525A2C
MSVADGVDRRAVMRIAGTAGVTGAGLLLGACGNSDSDDTTSSSSGGSTGAATTTAATSAAGSGGEVLAKASDVPVGGGVITDTYVVTQPESGTYKAFTNVCTHQGCKVAEVVNKVIKCNCHQSTFDISTGAPTGGPATSSLAETAVKESDGNIVKA